MQPSHNDPFGSPRVDRLRPQPRPRAGDSASIPSASVINGLRSSDSWVEISSHPSSASLSSVSNEIVTTGLSVTRHDERRSRQLQAPARSSFHAPRSGSATGSSQDEYEESESESDRVMSSSNEDMSQPDHADADADVDDDDTQTALGVGTSQQVFTPQPNAFSHPPSARLPVPDSYFPPSSAEPRSADRPVPQRSYTRHSNPRSRHPTSSYQPDHDAALRASLTTLLSCAAAIKPKGPDTQVRTSPPRTTQPTSLRLVPESELKAATSSRRRSPSPRSKRKSRESSKERHAKKAKAAKLANDDLPVISPTLVSWMISAGLVLVFSAISFSAGYAWGKEVGRLEGEMGLGGGSSCGKEALKGSGSGLRRLRWGTASVVKV